MDIPSVRGPPVSVKMPADRVSTQVLPLADSFSAEVNREKYHNATSPHLLVYSRELSVESPVIIRLEIDIYSVHVETQLFSVCHQMSCAPQNRFVKLISTPITRMIDIRGRWVDGAVWDNKLPLAVARVYFILIMFIPAEFQMRGVSCVIIIDKITRRDHENWISQSNPVVMWSVVALFLKVVVVYLRPAKQAWSSH